MRPMFASVVSWLRGLPALGFHFGGDLIQSVHPTISLPSAQVMM